MNFDDVKAKYRRKNKILFSRESLCLQELIALICKQKHRTIVMWILQWANQTADILNKRYPDEERFNNAIVQSTRWAMGKIKMPIAKKAILDYEVLKYNEEINLSVIKVNLHTGRHHQIRVQFASRKHSLYGDQKYGSRGRGKQLALWAYSLSFKHPTTKENLTFTIEPKHIGSWKILD